MIMAGLCSISRMYPHLWYQGYVPTLKQDTAWRCTDLSLKQYWYVGSTSWLDRLNLFHPISRRVWPNYLRISWLTRESNGFRTNPNKIWHMTSTTQNDYLFHQSTSMNCLWPFPKRLRVSQPAPPEPFLFASVNMPCPPSQLLPPGEKLWHSPGGPSCRSFRFSGWSLEISSHGLVTFWPLLFYKVAFFEWGWYPHTQFPTTKITNQQQKNRNLDNRKTSHTKKKSFNNQNMNNTTQKNMFFLGMLILRLSSLRPSELWRISEL